MNYQSGLPNEPIEYSSIEAEQQLLGAILTNNENYHRVASSLSPRDFFDPVHARIYDLAGKRIRKSHLASPVTMIEVMQGDDGLKDLGGTAYLARLAASSISSFAIADYASIILSMAAKRLISEALQDATSILASNEPTEVVTRLQHAMAALPEAQGQESTYSLLKASTDALFAVKEARDGNTKFLKTGISSLDAILRGLGSDDLMLLGGTTSMGKTATAIKIAAHTAFSGGDGGVAFWSLEMSPSDLANRLISEKSSVPYSAMRDPSNLEENDFRRWVEGTKFVSEGAMQVIPKHIRDIAGGHAAIKKTEAEMKVPLRLIVVDYAQLIRGEGRTRYEQMTSVSIGLKTMAGLIGCPVIGLVQLDRSIGHREDRRPVLSDIKETGQFENDADQVVFCNREEYWLQRSGPKLGKDGTISTEARADWESDKIRAKNKMELIVRKNRHGRLATAETGFHAPTNRFWRLGDSPEDLAEQEVEF